MNRHGRRAEAAKRSQRRDLRGDTIRTTLRALADAAECDTTISGATLFMPSGEVIYLDADHARAMADGKPGGPLQ